MQKPKYQLSDVVQLITTEKFKVGHKRAVAKVIEHLSLDNAAAEQFILDEVKKLKTDNFSHRALINEDVFDVYGKRIRSIPWYIKFSILKDEAGQYLWQISFHPTEEELKTRSEVLEKYEGGLQ